MAQEELPAQQCDSALEQAATGAGGSDMVAAIATLRSLSGAVMGLLTETDSMATGLAGDIKITIAQLNSPELQAVINRELPAALDRLASAVWSIGEVSPDHVGLGALAALQSQYTMQSERQVHELFAADTCGGRSFQTATPPGNVRSADDLGDNVELF